MPRALAAAPRSLVRALAALCLALMALPALAQAETAMTLGIYLWTNPDAQPVQAQYMSIASGVTETDTDGPDGYHTETHPTTAAEIRMMQDAISDRMKALTVAPGPQVPAPYVTVEWHVSHDNGYAEGLGTYPVKGVPAAIRTFQADAFGAAFKAPAN